MTELDPKLAELVHSECGEAANKALLVAVYKILLSEYDATPAALVEAVRNLKPTDLEDGVRWGIELSLMEFS